MRLFRVSTVLVLMVTMAGSARAADAPFPDVSPVASEISLDEVMIELERTVCFGSCPTYKLTISGRGEVTFEGIDHVAAIGSHIAHIPVKQVVALVNRFLDAHFFHALERYEHEEGLSLQGDKLVLGHAFISDAPTTILRLRLGEASKSVELYHNYPPELGELAETVDRVAGSERWVKRELP